MRYIYGLNPATVTDQRPTRLGDTHNPDWNTLHASGWRLLDDRADYTPPEGNRVTGYTYAQDPERPDYATETPITEAIPEPRPKVFPHGVEVGPGGLLVIPSHSAGKGIAIVPTDDGDLITVEVHASP